MTDELAPPGMVPLLCPCGRRIGWQTPGPSPSFLTPRCPPCNAQLDQEAARV